MVLWGRERWQGRDEQRDVIEGHPLVFFEPEAEPAGGEAAVAVRLFPRDQCGQLERLAIVTRPISRAVTSASTRLSCSSARRKIVREWPCEVDAAPLRGRDGFVSLVRCIGGGGGRPADRPSPLLVKCSLTQGRQAAHCPWKLSAVLPELAGAGALFWQAR